MYTCTRAVVEEQVKCRTSKFSTCALVENLREALMLCGGCGLIADGVLTIHGTSKSKDTLKYFTCVDRGLHGAKLDGNWQGVGRWLAIAL